LPLFSILYFGSSFWLCLFGKRCCREGKRINLKILAVIPARYDSVRFPGKVLAKDTGKYLIQHTYERTSRAKLLSKVIIATDSDKVMAACREFGAECAMTSTEHQSGTDRIAEAAAAFDADIVVNVQADEPEIDPSSIDKLAGLLMDNPKCPMATLAADFEKKEQVGDPNIVKVVVDKDDYAIYFSRSAIPYDRAAGGIGNIKNYMRHLGIYAYRKKFLSTLTKLPQTSLEKLEKLEQLRVIENGYKILAAKVEHTCDGIDTQEQYKAFVKRYMKQELE
jgi:3-deoxy-manno-octulosonate cytidylyltransferase (CMP-KDO synthetase)